MSPGDISSPLMQWVVKQAVVCFPATTTHLAHWCSVGLAALVNHIIVIVIVIVFIHKCHVICLSSKLQLRHQLWSGPLQKLSQTLKESWGQKALGFVCSNLRAKYQQILFLLCYDMLRCLDIGPCGPSWEHCPCWLTCWQDLVQI